MITKLMTSDLTESKYAITEIVKPWIEEVTTWRVYYIPVGRDHPCYQTYTDCRSKEKALESLQEQWEQYEDWFRWAKTENVQGDFSLDFLSMFFKIEEIATIANIYRL